MCPRHFALVGLLLAPVAAAAPAPESPEILFTFDDGPNVERTPKVLDALDAHGIKAVFFVNGWHFMKETPEATRARDVLRDIVRRGHAVGNHTVHHYFLCGQRGRQDAGFEIEENARLIERAIGMRPLLYRTPYGSRCRQLDRTLAELGVVHTHWDIDPQDWKVHNTVKVRDYVIRALKRLQGRAILLFHDVHEDTVRALPQILAWIDLENQARASRGEPTIRILDYGHLLPPHPEVPPLLDGIGHALVDQLPLEALRAGLRFLGLPRAKAKTS